MHTYSPSALETVLEANLDSIEILSQKNNSDNHNGFSSVSLLFTEIIVSKNTQKQREENLVTAQNVDMLTYIFLFYF